MAQHSTDTRQKIVFSMAVLVALQVVGFAGFMLFGDDRTPLRALWLTSQVLTTIGAFSDTDLNDAEIIWGLVLGLSGVLTVFYVGMNVVALIVDGELSAAFGRRKLENKINKLEHHVVVCGFGRMGRALCEALAAKGVPFVVIERDGDLTAKADGLDYLYIQGDAMDGETLAAARLDHARGLAACLPTDADNVFVTLTARGMAPTLSITARAENVETEEKLQRAGADHVICPPVLGAHKVLRMILDPAVDELLDLAMGKSDLEVAKVSLEQLPHMHGKTLKELALPSSTGMMIVSITHADGTQRFSPPADTVLKPDDHMIVIGPIGGVERVVAAM